MFSFFSNLFPLAFLLSSSSILLKSLRIGHGNQQDIFSFEDGAGVSGIINGGFGFNILNYSAYTGEITVDLGTSAATGTGNAVYIHEFIGGMGEDTFVGASAPNRLNINQTDEGTINDEINFRGFENLRGTANNEDAFILGAGGRITGTIEGGGGGYDSLLSLSQETFICFFRCGLISPRLVDSSLSGISILQYLKPLFRLL